MVNGDENPLCTAALGELPGYSRFLHLCPGTARYITLQSPNATALDVCTLSVYAQSALRYAMCHCLAATSLANGMSVAVQASSLVEVMTAPCMLQNALTPKRRLMPAQSVSA